MRFEPRLVMSNLRFAVTFRHSRYVSIPGKSAGRNHLGVLYPNFRRITEKKGTKNRCQCSGKGPVKHDFLCRNCHLMTGCHDNIVDPDLLWDTLANLGEN